MIKNLPNKWVRKAILTALKGLTVNGIKIPCFDSRVPPRNSKDHYILMTTQTNNVEKTTFCGSDYRSTILLDIVTTYSGSGNKGSKELADDILDNVRALTDVLTLDVSSNLRVHRQTQNFPNDIVSITPTKNIYRNFLRLEMFIV